MFVEYQKFFGETQKLGKEILKQLVGNAWGRRSEALVIWQLGFRTPSPPRWFSIYNLT